MKDIASTISLSKETKQKLESLGKKGETFDQIVSRILDKTYSHYPSQELIENPNGVHDDE